MATGNSFQGNSTLSQETEVKINCIYCCNIMDH